MSLSSPLVYQAAHVEGHHVHHRSQVEVRRSLQEEVHHNLDAVGGLLVVGHNLEEAHNYHVEVVVHQVYHL